MPFENEDPGPGAYKDLTELKRLGAYTESDSKKVEGKYFISCEDRFKN